MLNIPVGMTYMLPAPTNIIINNYVETITAIQPLCLVKCTLNISDQPVSSTPTSTPIPVTNSHGNSIISIISTGDCVIDEYIYSVEYHLSGTTLIIRPTREFLFTYYCGQMDQNRSNTALETIDDLQMDVLLRISDAMIANGTITLNETETTNYNKLKAQWQETTSVTLNTATYEIDYALKNGTPVDGPGLKYLARQYAEQYKLSLAHFNYIF